MARRSKNKAKKGGNNAHSSKNNQRQPKIVEDNDIVDSDDDEEIPEDEAFNSEDERLFGHFFQDDDGEQRKKKNTLDSSEDVDVTTDEEDDDDDDEDNSDDDDDEDDDGQYMLDLLNKLDASNDRDQKQSLSKMGIIPESDYSNSISKNGLTLDNLMASIQDTQGFRDLQKTFAKQQTATTAPLSNVVANRMERKLVYESRSKDISRWVKVVQENRKAETLDFKPKERAQLTREVLVDKFEPKTDFEKEIEQALEDAGQQDEEAVLKAEEEALQDDLGANRLTMEEYKKRRGQLAQIRALMFYHEQKRHHMKKIKSKKYRRIRKKQRERLKESALEAAMEQDEDLAQELKEKEEVARIQERMTLAHKNTSKWAKRILKRGKNVDVDTRRALSAQLKRGDDLRRKMMGEQSSDDESSATDDEDLVKAARNVLQDTEESQDPTNGKTGLFKLSFMQKGIQKQREQAKEEARKLLEELQANEMDDYDNFMKSDEGDGEAKPAPRIASAKEMEKVLPKGELVAKSLEFGNSNTLATSGGIDIDLGGEHDSDEESDNCKRKAPEFEEIEEFVSTMDANKRSSSQASSKDQEAEASHSSKKKRKASPSSPSPMEKTLEQIDEDVNPWIQHAGSNDSSEPNQNVEISRSAKRAKQKGLVDIAGAVGILDAAQNAKRSHDSASKPEEGHVDTTGEKMLTSLTQEELVRRAFVGQSEKEIDEEFEKEKEAMSAENDPTRKKKEDKTSDDVAGWGSWAGKGALPPKPRKLPKKLQAPKRKLEDEPKRLDHAKPGVIINQKRMKKTANNFMLGDVPHPYATRLEYEQAMLGGIGKEWNVSSSFKSLTRPEILTRSGRIIQPISKKAKQPRPAAKF
ncbi:UTP14 domain containing protein [Nitzschia inconspicua]|uniref:UTP14 domain containing protein n=1 Tax=Nitzschia inconspicua TaxID=303405 RepID=A0A9K3PR42_9STRA|nr:UTP14 domain containing protein [Nitzschia inconspicua]